MLSGSVGRTLFRNVGQQLLDQTCSSRTVRHEEGRRMPAKPGSVERRSGDLSPRAANFVGMISCWCRTLLLKRNRKTARSKNHWRVCSQIHMFHMAIFEAAGRFVQLA
jgi:hypothetical protein